MTAHVVHELVEGRPAIVGAADAVADVLDGRPAAGGHIPPQVLQLVVGGSGRASWRARDRSAS